MLQIRTLRIRCSIWPFFLTKGWYVGGHWLFSSLGTLWYYVLGSSTWQSRKFLLQGSSRKSSIESNSITAASCPSSFPFWRVPTGRELLGLVLFNDTAASNLCPTDHSLSFPLLTPFQQWQVCIPLNVLDRGFCNPLTQKSLKKS